MTVTRVVSRIGSAITATGMKTATSSSDGALAAPSTTALLRT